MPTSKNIDIQKLQQEAVMDSLNVGIILMDQQFKVIDVNKAFMNLFWIKEAELRGKSDSEFYNFMKNYFNTESREKFMNLAKPLIKSKKLIGDTFDAQLHKPWEIYINVFTSPIFDDNEGFVGRIWKFENINEIKQIDNMKTEFISIASHQLRTPITTIKGYTQMIIDGDFGEVNDEIKSSLLDMRQASDRLITLINALLDVSKLELGKIEPEYTDENIYELIKSVVEDNKFLIESKNISLRIEAKKSLSFNLDKALFIESIKNYISNAVKYTPDEGTVIITSEIKGKYLYFEVMDSGIGIPSSQIDGLFTKFFRADNVLTENIEGTGLGLYYVKKSIEALGGKAGYKPGDMNGSTFYFTIPQREIDD